MLKKYTQRVINGVINVVFWLCVLFVLFLLLRIFFFSSFKIPSDSMAPALYAGDRILIVKTIPGPRLVNLFTSSKAGKKKVIRLPGYRKVRRGDVIVFNSLHPDTWERIEMDFSSYYVKRCIGLPGDTLRIENGFYKINNDSLSLGNRQSQEALSRLPLSFIEEDVWRSFPYDSVMGWNIKDFGPLYIPKAGDKIDLNRTHFRLYKKIIEWEQQEKLYYIDGFCFLKDKPVESYTFSHNYYFMGGDRVEDSQDSRYWGLLPEEYITGKAVLVWMAVDLYTGKYEWNRFFRKIK